VELLTDTLNLRRNHHHLVTKSPSKNSLNSTTSLQDEQNLINMSKNNNKASNSRLIGGVKKSHKMNQSLNEHDLIARKYIRKKTRNSETTESDYDNNNNIEKEEVEDDDEEDNNEAFYNSELNLNFKKKSYCSLHKSKRSIKTIEKTIKNSKSIEKWLNDFEKIKELDLDEAISYRRQLKLKTDSTLDLNLSDLSPNSKLIETIKNLMDLNQSLDLLESDMENSFSKFMVPKSLANSEDINFLKWLLNEKNFKLNLAQPCLNEQLFKFLLNPVNLQISIDNNYDLDTNLDDQTYLKFCPDTHKLILLVPKIEKVLLKEKELTEQQTLNSNQSVLDEFKQRYVDTPNFIGAKCLMNIYKKRSMISYSQLKDASLGKPSHESIDLAYSDLNERLFSCFLSNFSCNLSEFFLNSQSSSINTFGFIRKHAKDASFSFMNIVNSNEIAQLKLTNIKFCFKSDKWPKEYNFIQRLDTAASLDKKLLNYLEMNTCLIATNEDQQTWHIECALAEATLFKSLSKLNLFKFYFFYIMINNLTQLMGISEFNMSKKVLLHHFLRYMELNNFLRNIASKKNNSYLISREILVKFSIDFSEYLRVQVFSKHKTLNRPNFFNPSLDIDDENLVENNSIEFKNTSVLLIANFDQIMKQFESIMKSSLKKKFEFSSLNYKCLSLSLNAEHLQFNDYVLEFFKILFEQFKLKRDNFKINEKILMEIHLRVLKANRHIDGLFKSTTTTANKINSDDYNSSSEDESKTEMVLSQFGLLEEFELYAECVHKYLPSVRQLNQFLLFHYVWTMQVQYLAPFFNYLSNSCKVYS
jgi:hypothetical protein